MYWRDALLWIIGVIIPIIVLLQHSGFTEVRSSPSSQALKKRDRQRGDKRAVSHFQIRDGGWGTDLPLSSCSHLKADTLCSPLYLETMALVLWIIPCSR